MKYNKAIGFAPELVPLIKNGQKTLTYRLGEKYNYLKIGDSIPFRNSVTDEVFTEVIITEKSLISFKDLPINRAGHELYLSKEEQKKVFKKYYSREVDDSEQVLVLGFKVIKP